MQADPPNGKHWVYILILPVYGGENLRLPPQTQISKFQSIKVYAEDTLAGTPSFDNKSSLFRRFDYSINN